MTHDSQKEKTDASASGRYGTRELPLYCGTCGEELRGWCSCMKAWEAERKRKESRTWTAKLDSVGFSILDILDRVRRRVSGAGSKGDSRS